LSALVFEQGNVPAALMRDSSKIFRPPGC
jgi:hypothetical protein